MINSMTGFGQAAGGKSPRWVVEIRSWNHRFFECSTRVPNVLFGFEDRIRDLIHARVKRGKIAVSISLRAKQTGTNGLILDEEKIDFYIRSLRAIQRRHQLKDSISVNALLAVPNLFTVEQKENSGEEYWASLKRVIEGAVDQLLRAKATEGSALAKDLKKRVGLIGRSIQTIETAAKRDAQQLEERLKTRVLELARGVDLDGKRLEQETAFLAERSDITEELVRSRHHIASLRKTISSSGESGKKLDFIAQEVHREANTIASKAQSSQIAQEVIEIKTQLEKIREQIQNIE